MYQPSTELLAHFGFAPVNTGGRTFKAPIEGHSLCERELVLYPRGGKVSIWRVMVGQDYHEYTGLALNETYFLNLLYALGIAKEQQVTSWVEQQDTEQFAAQPAK